MNIGTEIRRRREEQGLKQFELAEAVGTGPAAISRIENGRQTPTLPLLVRIAEALDADLSDLFPKAQPLLPFEEAQQGAEEPTTVTVDLTLRWHTLAHEIVDLVAERLARGEEREKVVAIVEEKLKKAA